MQISSANRARPATDPARPSVPPLPILLYHTISDGPGEAIADFNVRPDDLARHLDIIVAGGHPALTVSALAGLWEQGLQPPPGAVVITFDDGFEDNLSVAAPMLAARGLPATVYVTTGFLPGCPGSSEGLSGRGVGRSRLPKPPVPGPMLVWSRLIELEEAGLEVGAHGHTHRQLDVLSPSEASLEIRHSKELLEEALGHPVLSFAYPHGYAGRRVQDEVRRCGFRTACGVRNALSYTGDDRWLLARLTVRSTTTSEQVGDWLAGAGAPMATFGERLQTKGWRAARRAAAMGSTFTRAGRTSEGQA